MFSNSYLAISSKKNVITSHNLEIVKQKFFVQKWIFDQLSSMYFKNLWFFALIILKI